VAEVLIEAMTISLLGMTIGFVCLIWVLIGLGEARSGVSRIFQELEYERQLGLKQHE
jgi:hypothetical protein